MRKVTLWGKMLAAIGVAVFLGLGVCMMVKCSTPECHSFIVPALVLLSPFYLTPFVLGIVFWIMGKYYLSEGKLNRKRK